MRIIAVTNQKGGSGKTTTAVNLAAGLADRRQKVLLVDLDPQGSATSWMLSGHERPEANLFTHTAINEQIVATGWAVDLVPSSPGLLVVERDTDDNHVLKTALSRVRSRYDWILIDCPPSLGLLSFNAMMAATTVVAPVEAHVLALDGLALLEQTVELVSSRRRAALSIGAIIPCRVSRTRLAREVVENLRARFGKLVTTTVIRENIKLAEAPRWHQPIQTYAPDSNGAADYSAVSGELLRKLK
jgi:chromosome partitioning protein